MAEDWPGNGACERADGCACSADADEEQIRQGAERWLGELVLGSFRIESILGHGSFATAYLAQQIGTERRAVVKIAHPELLHSEAGETYRRFFETEVRTATRVTHPNLVTIYVAGYAAEELPAVAMEYVPGQTMWDFLAAEAPLEPPVLGTVFSQLAAALEALHEQGVIHRDVSPDNIMLTPIRGGNRLKATLLDFGIAQFEGSGCAFGGPVGTPPYIAPELMRGEYSTRSDLFSLGALVWWAMTGRPYLDTLEVPEQLEWLANLNNAPDPRSVRSDIPEEMASFVRMLLEPNPILRPDATRFLTRWHELVRAWVEPDADAVPQAPPLPLAGRSTTRPITGRKPTTNAPAWLRTSTDRVSTWAGARKTDPEAWRWEGGPRTSTPRLAAEETSWPWQRKRSGSDPPMRTSTPEPAPAETSWPWQRKSRATSPPTPPATIPPTPAARRAGRRVIQVTTPATGGSGGEARGRHLQSILEDLEASSDDVLGAVVLDRSGLVLASFLPPGVESEMLPATASTLLGMGGRLSSELMQASSDQVFLRAADGYVMVSAAGRDGVLVTLTSADAKLGLVLLDTRRASEALARIM